MNSVRAQPSRTAVQRTADALREEILQAGDGARLGSEDDLLTRLSVSRPTLRQTARLLEQEQKKGRACEIQSARERWRVT